jgi:predicted O-methyltransferase YrrM
MLSGKIQGKLLTWIVSWMNATHVLEIGTFTAYGSICLARGITTTDGKVVTIEANRELSFLIEKHISLAGLENKIEYLFGDAILILPTRTEKWDIVYIDAHKQEYPDYFAAVIDNVRSGGLIISDNVLWSGKVIYEPDDVDARVIRQYNTMLAEDPRVDVLMLPIRDGLSIARKK